MILIISCAKNIDKIKPLLKQLEKFEYVVCHGDKKLFSNENNSNCFFLFEENKKTIILDCDDGYDGLTDKVYKGIKAIRKLFNPNFIVKMDDDVVPNPTFLKEFLQRKNFTDYEGNKLIIDEPYLSYHGIKKFTNPKNKNPFLVGPVIFCTGPVYFLSRKAYEILIDQMGNFVEEIKLEDVCVGTILNKNFIYPTHINIYCDDFYSFRDQKFICWHSGT